MKTRSGFVSNSSSASFILQLSKMSDVQEHAMSHIVQVAKTLDFSKSDIDDLSYWTINEDSEFIRGSTVMDNDGMDRFFKAIGLSQDAIIEYGGD